MPIRNISDVNRVMEYTFIYEKRLSLPQP